MAIRTFRDLEAWKGAHHVTMLVYRHTRSFPKEEMFALTNQMRRAAISAESNIAEGFGRATARDKRQFYAISAGSLNELQSQAFTAMELGYLTRQQQSDLEDATVCAIRLCQGLQRSAIDRA